MTEFILARMAAFRVSEILRYVLGILDFTTFNSQNGSVVSSIALIALDMYRNTLAFS